MSRLLDLLFHVLVRPTPWARKSLEMTMVSFYQNRPALARSAYYASAGNSDPFGLRTELLAYIDVGGCILEVGCGKATLADQVVERGGQYYGADVDPEAVDLARRRPGVVEVRCESISMLSYDQASFDFVCSHYVLEHLAHPEEALRRLWQLVRPGGYLAVLCPQASRRWFPSYPWTARQEGIRRCLRHGHLMNALQALVERLSFAAVLWLRGVMLRMGRRPWFPTYPHPRCLAQSRVTEVESDYDMVYFANDLEIECSLSSFPDAVVVRSSARQGEPLHGQCFVVARKARGDA
jgi:SAM-dependent methyltransferase